jgi:hypothetical protein
MPCCFACGKPMPSSGHLAWCEDCDVYEEQSLVPFVSRVRTAPSCIWFGTEVEFLDHSSGNYPSPALPESYNTI